MSKYKDDKGNWVDATKIQEELTDKAIERTYDKEQNIDEDMYMQALYPKEHDEYLVDGAILECSMETLMPQVLRGRLYQVNMPSKLPLSSDDITGVLSYEEYNQSKYNPGDLALIFHASYERSGDDTKALQERDDAAMGWYNFFMNNQ